MNGLEEVLSVVRRHAAETDRDAAFPTDAMDAIRSSGLLGLPVPAEYGGQGGTLREVLDTSSALSRECLSVGMIYTMHCQQALTLVRFATSPLRERTLARIGAGELYLASVTTEPGTGGHLLSSESPLQENAATLRIDREAPIVTGGAYADGFLITMLAPGARTPHQVSLVFADREQLEVSVTGDWRPLGMRATHSVPLHLKGDVPAEQLVGTHGGFRAIAVSTFGPLAHLGWSACWLGAACGALERTVRMLRTRRERSTRDLTAEPLQLRLSRIRSRLDGVHAMLRHTAGVYEAAEDVSAAPVQLLLNGLKINASEQCFAAVNELVELAGLRDGYTGSSSLALERALRDLRSASLNYGNDRLHLVDGPLVLMDQEVRLA